MKRKIILTVYLALVNFFLLTAQSSYETVKIRTYLYAGTIPVSVTENGQTQFMGTDALGSVRVLTDRYGMITAKSSYDVFGSPVKTDAAEKCGMGYAGKAYDSKTQLYDYGFRDYSPENGRFTSVDPIKDGSNWYTYVHNDPVNYVDLWGLKEVIAGNLVMLSNGKIQDKISGLKDKVAIEIQRTAGHTMGHYLSELSINVAISDNESISLFKDDVQSWADKANTENGGFTISAGVYEGRLYGSTGSYLKPIGLVNDDLAVYSSDMVLIHGNVMNNYPVGDERRKTWQYTGSSEACQILQGQDKAVDAFTSTIEQLGFTYGNGYMDYTDTIKVVINDPKGIITTRDGKEIKDPKKGK